MLPDHQEDDSVTEWIVGLKCGDQYAAQRILDRYMSSLIRIANKRLGSKPRRVSDEYDVVSIAFARFLENIDRGGFYKLNDRNDLWQILFTITDRKAVDILRRENAQFRGGGLQIDESTLKASASAGICSMTNGEPTAEYAAILTEQFAERLSTLNEQQRGIAISKMEGLSNQEISEERKISLRTVERRLYEIRELWR